jgi:hypothetical protein
VAELFEHAQGCSSESDLWAPASVVARRIKGIASLNTSYSSVVNSRF